MKKAFRITKSTLLLFCFSIIGTLFLSCEKEETPNEAPTCEITSPTNGDQFEVGETINILVEAGDSDGSIEEVKFYINGTEKGTVSKFPFSYSWNTSNEDTGDYDLKATSYDNESSNSSNEISIKLVAGSSGELPIAKFSATPTSGTAPLNVDFTDQSENNPTNWQWDFGDGNTSNQQNPSHTYNNDSSYTVSLTIGNNDGNDTETKTNYILVESAGEAPIAEFTATPTSGTAPLSINFTDQSENNPAIWQWDFGDGNSSNQQNPSHTYNNGGSYTVSLTVSNNDGNDTNQNQLYSCRIYR